MNRLEKLRQVVDEILLTQADREERRCGYVHLYGVSAICTMLALKRELDPEIASAAGMLHDIYTYRTRISSLHAHNSEEEARVILRDLGDFAAEEQKIIRSAIFNHSDKALVHEPYDELLKDADLLQHYLYNTGNPVRVKTVPRLQKVLAELALPHSLESIKVAEEVHQSGEQVIPRRAQLADLAEELAAKPLIGNEAQSGPDVYPLICYFPGAEIKKGFDWCASFVYHCCMQVGFTLPIKHPASSVRFAGVRGWLEWAQLPDLQFYHPGNDPDFVPERGDIVIFDDIVPNGLHDHIGIVLKYEENTLLTAEGNIANRSGIFTRDRFTHINGFIRIDNAYRYK